MYKKIKNNVWVRRIFVCIFSYLCVLSFNKITSLNGDPYIYWGGQYFGYNILSVVLFGVGIFLLNRYIKIENIRLRIAAVAGGLLLAMAIVYGAYIHFLNNIFISTGDTFLQFGMVFTIGGLCVPLMAEILLLIEKAQVWHCRQAPEEKKGKGILTKLKRYFRKHPKMYFLIIWLTIFLCHIPVFLAYWPGNFVFDARYQLANVNTDWYTTHHPLIHTLMMGIPYKFGVSIGNASVGYQFYTLAQMLILTSSFAYVLLYLYKKEIKTGVLIACWAFFALFPMNPLFGISATKDVLCGAFFLYFMTFLAKYFWDNENFKICSYIGMILSGTFLALFRNNALYAVLVSAVIIIVVANGLKEKGKLLLIFCAILILSKLINAGLMAYTNAAETDAYRESMSVPLQSMARVASYRGDELDPALYEELCMYLPEENIAAYTPHISDPVKNTANEALLKSNTFNFFKLWVKMGLQFPDEYIESFTANTMGYWYPLNQGYYVSADFAVYHTLIGVGEEIKKVNLCPWMSALYDPFFYHLKYRETPILGYLFRNAPYVWSCGILMLFAFYKKDRKLSLFGILPIIYLLTCMCGPMAALRYIYCLVVSMPLMISTLLMTEKSNKN